MMTILHYVWLPLTVIAYVGFWCAMARYFIGPEATPVGILSLPITVILIALGDIGANIFR